MKLISHRGNLYGPISSLENDPLYIIYSINKGFDVEIDLWIESNSLYLGHDFPKYKIKNNFLDIYKDKLWIHCKNLYALRYLYDKDFNYFWHQEDDFTLVSNKKIWTYPNKDILDKSIIVCKDLKSTNEMFKKNIYGICSDYVGFIKQKYNGV